MPTAVEPSRNTLASQGLILALTWTILQTKVCKTIQVVLASLVSGTGVQLSSVNSVIGIGKTFDLEKLCVLHVCLISVAANQMQKQQRSHLVSTPYTFHPTPYA